RETFQWAFKAKAGKRGFQPQSKPPVHTGGFDFMRGVKRGARGKYGIGVSNAEDYSYI
ncbi:hypothetical protein ACUXHY_003704, partial [Cytobacillus horneckiae]